MRQPTIDPGALPLTATPSTSGSSTEADPPTLDAGDGVGGGPRSPGRGTSTPLTVALVASVVALVCAALLAILPVEVNQPVVTWPADPSTPRSTALQLTTQRPLELDVSADCTAARAAGSSVDGLLLATLPPASPAASTSGLLATVRGDELTVASRGIPLFVGPLPSGPCRLGVQGDLDGTRVTIDGRVVGGAGPGSLPDLDALTTSVPPAGPGVPAGLSVRLTLDDQFATSPTPVKSATIALLVLAVLVTLAALIVRDRRAGTGVHSHTRWRPRLRLVDGVVPAVLMVWTVIAPMTDDDGYYSAMAANVPFSGYVANYYQLYNQSFTPFTWIYYALSAWQTTIGNSPFLLRVPALLLAIVSWVLVRAFAARALPAGRGRVHAVALHAALAAGFLAWWLPYNAGVRAEAVVATSVVASMVALSVGLERDRWALLGAGVGIAAFGATAAPTGFVALAPLLAALPAVWRRLRADVTVVRAFGRLVALCGPGALVGLLAFADGSLRDFLRAQQIFLGMQAQETWYTEIVRWSFLLQDATSMGNFAKRPPVLLGVLALVVFGVLAAHLRGRGRPVPPRASLAAITLLLGFALLWLTPSKWTHHFGTLAAVGSLVLGLTIVGAPVLLRAVSDEPGRRPVATPVLIGTGVLLAALAALAGHGANGWPYSWLLGLPDAGEPPTVAFVAFDRPWWWAIGGLALAAVVAVAMRRWAPTWRPFTGVVALSLMATAVLLVTTVYLVGGFTLATARTLHTWSPWADALRDPLGRDCGAAVQMQVLDPSGAVPLRPTGLGEATGGTTGTSFVAGGWFPSSPPPFDQERSAGRPAPEVAAWGSFVFPPAAQGAEYGADGTVGRFSTPWYAVPERPDGAMTTSVSGRTGGGNTLRVEYGRVAGGALTPIGGRELGLDPDGAAVDSPAWRGVLLEEGDGPPPGANVVRLVAEDTSTAPGGWLAFTAPTVQRWTSLGDYASPDEASAVSWQYAFLFPCQRKPVQQDGVNEPSTLGIVWGDQELAYRFDGIWQIGRGGMFAQSLRDSAVVGLVTRLRDHPDAEAGTVYRLTSPVPHGGPDAYRLDRQVIVVPGWSLAPNTTGSTPVDAPE